jgi:uncharacterized delta-60 repeat protein
MSAARRIRLLLLVLSLPAMLPLHAAGRLDPLFGRGGTQRVTFDVAPDFADQGYALVAQTDGRLVLAGPIETEGDRLSVGVARLTSNGLLDTSFGQSGRLVLRDAAGQFLLPFAAAVQTDDRIILTGARYPTAPVRADGGGEGIPAEIEWFVLRLLANGSGLDGSFGSGGIVLLNFGRNVEFGTALALQPDGRVLVAGNLDSLLSDQRMALARLNSNGTLDGSFSGDGLFDEPFAASYGRSVAGAVLLQSDGRILLAGSARKLAAPFDDDMAVLRLLGNGVADGSFGGVVGTGRAVVDFSSIGLTRDDRVYALAYRPPLLSDASRRIILGGQSEPETGPAVAALAVLTYAGASDAGFSADGRIEFSTGFSNPRSGVYAIALERINPLLLETSDRITFGGILPNVIGPACFAGRISYAGNQDIAFNGGNLLSLRSSTNSVKDECRGGLLRDERFFLVGTNAVTMTMTGDDFSAFAVLSGSFLFRDGFESGAD